MPLEKAGVQAVVEGLNSYLNDLKRMQQATAATGQQAAAAGGGFTSFGRQIASTALGFGAAQLAIGGIKAALSGSVGAFATYEKNLSAVAAVSGASKDQLDGLGETALRIGSDTMFSAREVSGAMVILSQAGLSAEDIMIGAADAAANLAAAGGTNLAQAADTVSTSMAVWGAKTSDLTEYVNRLAGAANVSRFDVDDMSQAIAQGGGAAAAAGISFADFSTSIAGTAKFFQSGSDAGTSFKQFLNTLIPNTDAAKDAMEGLGLRTKEGSLAFFDAQGQMKPLSQIAGILKTAFTGLSDEQRAQALQTIFGRDAMRTAIGIMEMGQDAFVSMSDAMKNSDAAEIARQRTDNLAGAWERLTGTIETLGIQFTSVLAPALTALADFLADELPNAINYLSETWRPAFLAMAEVLGPVVEATGELHGSLDPDLVQAFAIAIGIVTAATIAYTAAALAAALVNPFTAALLATVAITTGITYLILKWDELRERYEWFDTTATILEALAGGAVEAFHRMGDAINFVREHADQFKLGLEILAGVVSFGMIPATIEIIRHWDDLKAAFWATERAVASAVGAVEDAGRAVGDFGAAVWDAAESVAEALDDALQAVGDFAQSIFDWAIAFPGDVYDWFTGIGEAIVDGIKDGIAGAWDNFTDWFEDRLEDLKDLPGRVLGVSSPALSMIPVGEAIVQGIEMGISNQTPSLLARMQALGQQVISFANQIQASLVGLSGAALDLSHMPQMPVLPQLPGHGPDFFDIIAAQPGAAWWDLITGPVAGAAPTGPTTPTRTVNLGGGGAGGGAGKALKDSAQSAIDAFREALAPELEGLVKQFGETGAKAADALGEAIRTNSPRAGENAARAIDDLLDQLREDEIPNAEALGSNLMEAFARALTERTPEAQQAALEALSAVTGAIQANQDKIEAAGKLTGDNLMRGIAGAIAEGEAQKAAELEFGKAGARFMDTLDKALKDGGKNALATVSENAADIVEQLREDMPPEDASALGRDFMDALARAVDEKSPDAIAAFEEVMRDVGAVLDGGIYDAKTKTVLLADELKVIVDTFRLTGANIATEVGLLVQSGLTAVLDGVNAIAPSIAEAVTRILTDLQNGLISTATSIQRLQELASQIKVVPAGTGGGGATAVMTGGSQSDADFALFRSLAPNSALTWEQWNAMSADDRATALKAAQGAATAAATADTLDAQWVKLANKVGMTGQATSLTLPGGGVVTYADFARMSAFLRADLLHQAGVTGYAIGTPYVPRDQLAMIHEGEAIIPRAYAEILRASGIVPAHGWTMPTSVPLIQLSQPDQRSTSTVSVVADMRYSSFAGSPEDNAAAIERRMRDVIARQLGREAFLAGAR